MDIRQLRYFVAIAEQGSITRAAAHLGVAQPALSLHVRNMEETLGTQLLLRSKAGVTPTEAGTLLLHRARTILDDLARTQEDIRTLDADPMGEVRIGLPGTISNIVALPLIDAARAAYPRIRLTIAEAMSGFIADWLSEGRIDLAVLYEPSSSDGLHSELLLEEELVILWPPDHPAPAEIPLSALRDVAMVLPSGSHGLRLLVDRALAAAGFQPRVEIEIDSYANIKRLVTAGYGASILPVHAVQSETDAGRLKYSHIARPGLWRGAYLVHPTHRAPTRSQEAILPLVQQVIGGLLDNRTWAGARTAP